LKAFLLSDELQTTLKTERVEDALVIRVPDTARDTVNIVVVLEVKGKADVSRPQEIHPGLRIFVNKLGVTFSTERQEIEIRFTLIGTEPGPRSDLFAGAPVMLSETTTVTARCFRDGKPVSGSIASTFLKVDPIPSRRPFYSGNGLICRYFEGDWDSLPDFRSLTPLKTVVVDNFGIEEPVREEHYGLTFDGYIEVPVTGVFRFSTESDDGSRLWIDELLVVDNDGLHGMEIVEGAVPLASGLHGIRVEFFEKDGSDDLKVFWQVPGFHSTPVPDRTLFQNMR
ncbi:MAG: chitobiase/beta-hexosaminidase C-terminal domain-containing protein, partial [Bacteroidales bacterium]|nr:chitobiase/beta-hexosaminidase C-terminal domain-containing protein [Bacteroidales bacterium]